MNPTELRAGISLAGVFGLRMLGLFLILPVFAVVFMLIQQIQTMPPPSDEQQAMQYKMMNVMMIVIGFLFYTVPAGLLGVRAGGVVSAGRTRT
jgi:membrane protein insertase Oxa1/YidC/SpoIIIJ